MSIIEINGVNRFFGDPQVLKDIDFSVDEGRIVEVGTPEHFFQIPQNERTKRFLDQILH
jgi:ABC-type polar amino acid transport system ATPase subunit